MDHLTTMAIHALIATPPHSKGLDRTMPLLALLIIACQVTCGLHVVRSGQDRYWLYLIIALPGIGCLIYFLGIMLPELLGSRRGRRALGKLHDSIDPQRHLRALRDELEIRDTRDTRVNLADELLRMGQAQEAAQHYQQALRGIHSDAPDILLGLARARFALGDFAGCQASLDQLIAQNPDFRSADGHLLYARALEAQGNDLKAEEEYRVLGSYCTSPEELSLRPAAAPGRPRARSRRTAGADPDPRAPFRPPLPDPAPGVAGAQPQGTARAATRLNGSPLFACIVHKKRTSRAVAQDFAHGSLVSICR